MKMKVINLRKIRGTINEGPEKTIHVEIFDMSVIRINMQKLVIK